MRVKHLKKKRKGSPKNRYFLTEAHMSEGKHIIDVLNSKKKRGELTDEVVLLHACGCGCGLFPHTRPLRTKEEAEVFAATLSKFLR